MIAHFSDPILEIVDDIYRSESRRILATLIRLVGDFDLAEEAMQEAFASAIQQWATGGVPANPRAWLVSTARFKAIDVIRRRVRFDASLSVIAEKVTREAEASADSIDEWISDDDLRLIFTCCHPALPSDGRIALTLREVCGLTTEEIARAFLSSPSTIAQRIVRAKSKIKSAGIPYQVPNSEDLPDRLDTVLHVVYLVFNEGYSASFGDSLTRADLSGEAIRLARLLVLLIPEPEVLGLLALLVLQESRRLARTSSNGDLILLADQDRTLWNREYIREGQALVARALGQRGIGRYTLQAAIAAVHASTVQACDTDWGQIVSLYDILLRVDPSPIVELNRAVAVAMRDGPHVGVALIDGILGRGDLSEYHLAHSARAELSLRAGDRAQARASFGKALALAKLGPERRYLEARLMQVPDDPM